MFTAISLALRSPPKQSWHHGCATYAVKEPRALFGLMLCCCYPEFLSVFVISEQGTCIFILHWALQIM